MGRRVCKITCCFYCCVCIFNCLPTLNSDKLLGWETGNETAVAYLEVISVSFCMPGWGWLWMLPIILLLCFLPRRIPFTFLSVQLPSIHCEKHNALSQPLLLLWSVSSDGHCHHHYLHLHMCRIHLEGSRVIKVTEYTFLLLHLSLLTFTCFPSPFRWLSIL